MSARAGVTMMLSLALGACSVDAVLDPPHATSHAALFDEIWREFDLHYAFFQLKGIDWDDARERYRPRALAAADDEALATVIATMLSELRDVHVWLTPGNGRPMRFVAETEARSSAREDAPAEYVTDVRGSSGGRVQYGLLDARAGYLRIPSFAGRGWEREVDEALRGMENVSAVVIDIRGNRGGNNGTAIGIAGRFADRTRTFGYVRLRNGPRHGDFTGFIPERVRPAGHRYRGEMFVLTDRLTTSSAEDFVLAMRSIPGTTILGDTTAGASGGPIVRELPNGWTYQLSEWIAYTAEREVFEGIGLAPDVTVTTAHALDAGADPALEYVRRAVAASKPAPGPPRESGR